MQDLNLPNLLSINRNLNKGYIYILICPETNLPFYVGRTKDIAGRAAHHSFHINEYALKRQESKTKKILELKKKNLYPIIQVVDIVEEDEMEFKETYWIQFLESNGVNITNIDKSNINKQKHKDIPVLAYLKSGEFFKEYSSTIELCDDLKIDKRVVQSVIHSMTPTAKGYYFKYKTEDTIEQQITIPGIYCYTNKPVLQIDRKTNEVIKEYSDYRIASKELNIRGCYISRALRYRHGCTGGFIWRFKNDEDKQRAIEDSNRVQRVPKKICYQYDCKTLTLIKKHEGVNIVAIENNWSAGTLAKCCRCNGLGYGFIWSYEPLSVDEIKSVLDTQQKRLHNTSLKRKLTNVKSVYVYTKDKSEFLYEFNSIVECAKFFGTSSTPIGNVCNGKTEHSLGLFFTFEKL